MRDRHTYTHTHKTTTVTLSAHARRGLIIMKYIVFIKRLVMAKTVLVEYLEDTYEVSFLSEESISD